MTFSLSTLALLVLASAVFAFWHDGARARETANRVAADACRRRSLQLLDGTVALARTRPRFAYGALRIERTFVFDYSVGAGGRYSGFLILLGDAVQHVGFGTEQ